MALTVPVPEDARRLPSLLERRFTLLRRLEQAPHPRLLEGLRELLVGHLVLRVADEDRQDVDVVLRVLASEHEVVTRVPAFRRR